METIANRPALRASHYRPFRVVLGSALKQRRNSRFVSPTGSLTRASSDKYDYILVGGGTAGCVLANRLTADGSKRVLMLESGGENNSMDIKAPAGLPKLFKSAFDWNLYTKLQDHADQRKIYIARGKVLGGSSSTNATLYMRGTAADYDGWNVPGWAAKDVLNWFIKCEDNSRGPNDGVHGVGGDMKVESPRYQNQLHDMFFQAAQGAGIRENPDFNDWGRSQEGWGEFQVCQDRGERADAFRQYLKPVLGRSNLTVLTDAKTLRIEMEQGRGNAVARGVTYQTRGPDGLQHSAEVKTGGEVIMCAGAVHTPHLLQLSGIGPQEELSRQGISTVADLQSVGRNLQDHPAVLAAYLTKEDAGLKSVTDELMTRKGRVRVRAALNFLLRRRGPITTTGCDHGALVSTRGPGERPDLQMRFVPGYALEADGIGAYVAFGKLKEQGERWPTGYTMQLLNVRPKSLGSVGLRSEDPWDAPKLDTNYLSDPEGVDLATLRNGLKLARRISQTAPLAGITEREGHPGVELQTDAEMDGYIRKTLHSGNAIVGTCRMGADSHGAVVNSQLQVFGVSGLRIADSSIIPRIPGGQTGAATVMIAERAADILLGREQEEVMMERPLALAA